MLAHEAEDVDERPLVAGEDADPDVHEGVRVRLDAGRVAQARGEAHAVRAADAAEGAAEGRVEGERLEPREGRGVARPAARPASA